MHIQIIRKKKKIIKNILIGIFLKALYQGVLKIIFLNAFANCYKKKETLTELKFINIRSLLSYLKLFIYFKHLFLLFLFKALKYKYAFYDLFFKDLNKK